MRSIICSLAGVLAAGCAAAAPEGAIQSEQARFRVAEVAGGLERPWALAFLPGGDMLVTERPGRLRLIEGGRLRASPVPGLPEIYASGQGGLLDVALDPDFARNATIYLSYSHEADGATTTRVMRATFSPGGLADGRVIFEAQPLIDSSKHFGSRLAFARDGTLFVTMGERSSEREQAQNLGSHLGKVMRIMPDGSVPADNPFVGRPGVLPEIYSYGHRNPQGMALNPATGAMWEQEHGARGGDEVNLLKPGANYGWPDVAFGVNYSGTAIGSGRTSAPGIEAPLFYWDPSIAPSGMTFYQGDRFPGWRGDVFVGALGFELVSRLDLDDAGRVLKEERLLEGELGRIRDVRTGPDGLVYLLTDENPGGLYRLEPAGSEAG